MGEMGEIQKIQARGNTGQEDTMATLMPDKQSGISVLCGRPSDEECTDVWSGEGKEQEHIIQAKAKIRAEMKFKKREAGCTEGWYFSQFGTLRLIVQAQKTFKNF